MVRAELLLCPQRDKAEMAAELCPGSLKAATDHRYTIFLSSVCVCVHVCGRVRCRCVSVGARVACCVWTDYNKHSSCIYLMVCIRLYASMYNKMCKCAG